MSEAIIEAAIDAAIHWTPSPYEIDMEDRRAYGALVAEIRKIVTPLIRAAALEEAAKVAESHYYAPQAFTLISTEIAAAIRALKPASPSPSDASA